MHISGKSKKDRVHDNDSISGSVSSLSTPGSGPFQDRRFGAGQPIGEADPGVNSEDEDEFAFDDISHKSSTSSLNPKMKNTPHMPPSQSPLAIHSTSSIPNAIKNSANDEDLKLRSKTMAGSTGVPAPSKPPRTASESGQVDDWEAKLYGKNLDGSSDSLKRRSWDTRVPLSSIKSVTEEFQTHERSNYNSASTTAPTSPNLNEQKSQPQQPAQRDDKPQPLPRSGTLESIVEREQLNNINNANNDSLNGSGKDKKSDKRFRLGIFRKNESIDDVRLPKNGLHQKQFGERIIIGHENDYLKQIEVSPELLNKYEGKSREVSDTGDMQLRTMNYNLFVCFF